MMVRYRRTYLQRVAGSSGYVLLLLLVLAVFELLTFRSAYPLSASEVEVMLESIFYTGLITLLINDGVDLAPAEILVKQGFGRRKIRWPEIAGVDVESKFSGRVVYLRKIDGKMIRLGAPASLLDRRFDEKVQVIRACWLGWYDWTAVRQK